MATPSPSSESELTVDAFLGGKVEAVQPKKGHHRSGLEAVLLGASLEPDEAGTIVDLGAGAGVAGFCAAARCARARIVLIEREAALVAAAEQALLRPANTRIAARVRIVRADITDRRAMGVEDGTADVVLINPPFNPSATMNSSPKPARASAHELGEASLDRWVKAAASLLKPGGRVTLIFRAEGLDALLAALARKFGALDILPVHPRTAEPAHRIMVTGVTGSRAPLRLLPPLVLHGETGNAFRPEVDLILREGRGLAEISGTWQRRP